MWRLGLIDFPLGLTHVGQQKQPAHEIFDGKWDTRVIKSMIDLTDNCAFKSETLQSDIT